MTILEMLKQSVLLAAMGMGVVFLFLCAMIISVNLTGWVIRKMGRDKDVTGPPSKPPGKTAQSDIVAAISVAVQEYRKTEERDV
jgi:sodium pump decarboxylase gamma subunit